ncbi:MAG: YdcF family protein [Myxococcales bacterium]|nr:YdcF family protein [Myxococcales bacterium]
MTRTEAAAPVAAPRRVAARTWLGAAFDGLAIALALALVVDTSRAWFTAGGSLLGTLVSLPGGHPLPSLDALVLALALLLRGRVAATVLGAHALLALANAVEFYLLRVRGLPGGVLPFSLLVAGIFAVAALRAPGLRRRGRVVARLAGAVVGSVALLLAHLASFGATDYARPAEAIVVFGARVYADGTASLSLADRVAHGVHLYEQGLAPVLILSGAADEVPVMRRLALAAGVPESALELDLRGVNTHATVANLRYRRVLAVSHYYHLARIKLAAEARGLTVYTSPCPMTRRLAREPYFVARECAALVAYYLAAG